MQNGLTPGSELRMDFYFQRCWNSLASMDYLKLESNYKSVLIHTNS